MMVGPRAIGWVRIIIACALIIMLMLVGWLGSAVLLSGSSGDETIIVFPHGSSIEHIAHTLDKSKVIRESNAFIILALITGKAKELRAGEYLFPHNTNAYEALQKITRGDVFVRRLTIAEGLSTREVFDKVSAAYGLDGTAGSAAEGVLLPETYYYTFGDSRRTLVERMRADMNNLLDQLWQERSTGLPFQSSAEALILASIVEKETAKSEERAHIAGVFINRLSKGMKLQSDVTVAYAIQKNGELLDRKLTRDDLFFESPYNTYLVHGLPPSPIANPGRASIIAVLNPLATDDLYFVADGKGGHRFANTLKEHNNNVRLYRKERRLTSSNHVK